MSMLLQKVQQISWGLQFLLFMLSFGGVVPRRVTPGLTLGFDNSKHYHQSCLLLLGCAPVESPHPLTPQRCRLMAAPNFKMSLKVLLVVLFLGSYYSFSPIQCFGANSDLSLTCACSFTFFFDFLQFCNFLCQSILLYI